MHALIENGAVKQYPYGLGQLKAAYPETSFPAQANDEMLASYGVQRVFFSTPPAITDAQVLEEGIPVFVDDRWNQTFTVREMTVEELQQRAKQIEASIIDATQARLDTFAQTRYYNGILSAATYATSAVPRFASDGQYCVNARDTTWGTLYQLLGEVQAGTRPMLSSYADVEPFLPVLEWPDEATHS